MVISHPRRAFDSVIALDVKNTIEFTLHLNLDVNNYAAVRYSNSFLSDASCARRPIELTMIKKSNIAVYTYR